MWIEKLENSFISNEADFSSTFIEGNLVLKQTYSIANPDRNLSLLNTIGTSIEAF